MFFLFLLVLFNGGWSRCFDGAGWVSQKRVPKVHRFLEADQTLINST